MIKLKNIDNLIEYEVETQSEANLIIARNNGLTIQIEPIPEKETKKAEK